MGACALMVIGFLLDPAVILGRWSDGWRAASSRLLGHTRTRATRLRWRPIFVPASVEIWVFNHASVVNRRMGGARQTRDKNGNANRAQPIMWACTDVGLCARRAACAMGYVRHTSPCLDLPERTPPILQSRYK